MTVFLLKLIERIRSSIVSFLIISHLIILLCIFPLLAGWKTQISILEKSLELPIYSIIITLLLLYISTLISFVILYISYTRKPKIKDFIFHSKSGFYEHKREHYFCCQKCLIKDGIESKLTDFSPREYWCRICNQYFSKL